MNAGQPFTPSYLSLLESGELQARVAAAYELLSPCRTCPRACGVDRLNRQAGVCCSGLKARVASYGPHPGEEAPLSGWRGSGAIFFARCNLRCQYCQNYAISQSDAGVEVSPAGLAEIMLELQRLGCHNINFVSPTHVAPQILAAVLEAARAGLRLPLVYNTGGYDSLEMLRLLDGVIDIYLPDMKYSSQPVARHYSRARDYPPVNQAAVREMHRQVGDLRTTADGLAVRGLMVRHLVLPFGLAGTAEVVRFLAEEISAGTYLNLMDQYHPDYNARRYSKLARRIKPEEYAQAMEMARQAGLKTLA